MRRIAIPSFLTLVLGCASADPDCFEVPASVAALRGGGWDANGVSLRGGWDGNARELGGGWDLNSDEPGAELAGVVLRDAASGAILAFDAGRLVDGEGAPIEHADVVATTPEGNTTGLAIAFVRDEDGVPLYEIRAGSASVCDEVAMFAPGVWAPDGSHAASDGVTVACRSGVIAKCAIWGYAPWATSDEVHVACTRMARADYCGDGMPWTRTGTLIDVADPEGIQSLAGGEAMTFEAGWDEDGAVCVRATRYDVVGLDGELVVPPCWASLPRCDDVDGAFAEGALVANGALHTVLPACR
jgi:hypothetical protein